MTDYDQPNTYAPNPDWPACKALVENEYRRMLGVEEGHLGAHRRRRGQRHVPRRARAAHPRAQRLNGIDIPHAGVYTVFTTNGHADEFVRFVAPDTVVLAAGDGPEDARRERRPKGSSGGCRNGTTSGSSASTTSWRGRRQSPVEPIRVVRIPTPELTLDVFQPGDGTYDYCAAYDDGRTARRLPELMLGVWAASYVNYVPTNEVVLVSKFWKPGRSLEIQGERSRGARRPEAAVPRTSRSSPGAFGERESRRRRDELHHPAGTTELDLAGGSHDSSHRPRRLSRS